MIGNMSYATNYYQDSISIKHVGAYEFIKDSVDTPNRYFMEKLELKNDSSFEYYARHGGSIGIKINISGKWSISGNILTLNSNEYKDISCKTIDCPARTKSGYYLDIVDLDGYKFNYSIKTGEILIRDLYGISEKINLNEDNTFQIISTSGIYSDKIQIDSTKFCYKIICPRLRQFKNEEWEIINGKIRPKGLDRLYAKYFLYKNE